DMSTIAREVSLCAARGERLDVRPQRGLARKARGYGGCSVNSFHPVFCLSSCKFFFVQGLFKGRPTFLHVCNAFISGDIMLGHGRRRTPPPPPTMGSSATRLPPRMRSDGAVFCARCALESWRFSNPDAAGAPDALFLLLVDLKKDFDAVPREEMFSLLSRCLHLPSLVIGMLRSLHEGMTASHCHSGRVGPPINMSTGVRQGSVEGPTLYLLYYSRIFEPDVQLVSLSAERSTQQYNSMEPPALMTACSLTQTGTGSLSWRVSSMIALEASNKVKTEWEEIPHPHAAMFGVPAGRSFSSGGHHSFVSRAKALLQQLPGVDERTWPVTAQDRQRWSRLVEQLEVAPQVRGVNDDDRYFLFPGRTRSSWHVAALTRQRVMPLAFALRFDVSVQARQAREAWCGSSFSTLCETSFLNPFLQSLAVVKESSPANKKSKDKQTFEATSAGAAPSRQHVQVQPLSCAELTRGYLDHDYQLRQLQASSTVVYRVEESKAGVAHPYGACSTAAVLAELCKDDECPEPIRVLLDAMLSSDMANVAREVSLCTARLKAKKTFMIMEFKAHVASPLTAYLPTLQLFFAKQGGEKLGMRLAGALARK
ncbi:RXLR78, partial [Symbiodinium necroappetens]